MEYTQWVMEKIILKRVGRVLILVVMEYTQWESRYSDVSPAEYES